MGEWVNIVAPVIRRPNTDLPEVSYGSWVTSSYDLLDGAEVIEDPDTLPGDLLDELFAPKPDVPEELREVTAFETAKRSGALASVGFRHAGGGVVAPGSRH